MCVPVLATNRYGGYDGINAHLDEVLFVAADAYGLSPNSARSDSFEARLLSSYSYDYSYYYSYYYCYYY